MEASSESPSLLVGEEKVPSEWERKMETLTSHLSSLKGFTTLFYYFRVSVCELVVLIAHTSGAVRSVSKQREGSLVPKHESSPVPEFKSSKGIRTVLLCSCFAALLPQLIRQRQEQDNAHVYSCRIHTTRCYSYHSS